MIRRYNRSAPIFRCRVVPREWIRIRVATALERARFTALPSASALFAGSARPRPSGRRSMCWGSKLRSAGSFAIIIPTALLNCSRLAAQASAAGRRRFGDHRKGHHEPVRRCRGAASRPPAVLAEDRRGDRANEEELLRRVSMRIAIFGGTFDPIHSAHLVVAHEAAEAFALDRVLFIPAGNPPHKEAGALL